ncbi:MAG TPA: iron-sulfur cluster assembly protein [Planctomycetota bacterium]|nr:iron-sulfur cluster assembly protein [Planctomycetota bacterium]
MSDTTTPAPTPATPPAQPATPAPAAAPAASGDCATQEEMLDSMKEIFDPEIPINIVDLGLIYKLENKDGNIDVEMTLTSPHCPVGDQLKARVNEVLMKQKGVKAVNVNLTFNPPWTKEKLTFDGKLQASMLGIM